MIWYTQRDEHGWAADEGDIVETGGKGEGCDGGRWKTKFQCQ